MGPPTLSGREREVLAWIAQGQSRTYIGARLGISAKTVEYYRGRLMDKLQLTNTMQLIRYAIANKGDMPIPVPVQPTPRPVSVHAVVSPMISTPLPIVQRSHSFEREEWPG
jgi:DNA-binding CsgD family transcriptional regulator